MDLLQVWALIGNAQVLKKQRQLDQSEGHIVQALAPPEDLKSGSILSWFEKPEV